MLTGVGLVPRRSDEIRSHRHKVVDEIRAMVASSVICVADITGHNANVSYALGLAHGLDRPLVILAQPQEDIPVELNDRRVLWYRPETVKWLAELREEPARSVRETLTDLETAEGVSRAGSARREAGSAARGELSLEDAEELLRDLLADGISTGTAGP